MTDGVKRNKTDVCCKKCKTAVITAGNATSVFYNFPLTFLNKKTEISNRPEISDEYKGRETYVDFEALSNVKMVIKGHDEKTTEAKFDMEKCIIDDIENYENFIETRRECWVTENMFETNNTSAQGKSVFCGNCYNKIKVEHNIDIIGWTKNYCTLKPVYIFKSKVTGGD